MSDSPSAATPYEVLGVQVTATQEEIRRAYRRLLRETHPDTGGSAARFVAVQRAWERIATPELRAAYDRGARGADDERVAWSAPAGGAPPRRGDTRPSARSHGHPGGWRRERFLALIREWAGRGADLPDPYDPALVRSAPAEIRHILADALAEEATARALSSLGIGYTVWHDVATGDPEDKIDHVVLGPTGLFAMLSEDFGGEVRARRGELVGAGIGDARPVHALEARSRVLARAARVAFTGLLVVLPDDALEDSVLVLGRSRGAVTAAVRSSVLPALLRVGLPGGRPVGGTELFDVRTRLQAAIRFV